MGRDKTLSVTNFLMTPPYRFFFFSFFFYQALGPSMQPTLNDTGDVLITEAVTPRLQRLRKGDIVVATKPTNRRVSILKRIVGMAGDEVDGAIVPPGHVWLQGDNSAQSTDSRHYGAVPLSLVRAKAWCRIWPPRQATLFESLTARNEGGGDGGDDAGDDAGDDCSFTTVHP